MQSNGGLTDAWRFQEQDAILSGPAAASSHGALPAATPGSTRHRLRHGWHVHDVSHYAVNTNASSKRWWPGADARADESIHTVAPEAARSCTSTVPAARRTRFGGATRPACYRRGGPLAVTDANVMLGRVQPEFFPHVFGPHGTEPLDRAVV